jgi:pyruvate/2-oxoglutarate dehydrogenase complex dihydrolipoamide acyltransferase (E2) component
MQNIEVRVPDIGDFKDIPIIELLVKPGDVIQPGDPLLTLESDKATLDVPAPLGGRVADAIGAKAASARAGKLKLADMEGGCFTISSLGGIGGTGFTPIINAPEVAILGAGKAAIRPQWDGQQFQPRLILPLSLSWDHRALDGAAAARFLVHLVQLLQDFRRVLL